MKEKDIEELSKSAGKLLETILKLVLSEDIEDQEKSSE